MKEEVCMKVSTAETGGTYYLDTKEAEDVYSGTNKHSETAAVLRATDDGWVLLWEAELDPRDFL
jgi:hypothetical protein